MSSDIRAKVQLAIVLFLGTMALTLAAGALYLQAIGKSVPDSLLAIGSTAVGGLLAYLQKDPQQIQTETIHTDTIETEGSHK